VHQPRQPKPFDPRKAALLDDPARERWLPSNAVVALLRPRGGERILDYGTGTARYAIALARRHPEAEVVAYDVSEEMLALARTRVRDAGLQNVAVAGPESGELHPRWFDRILAMNVLHEIGMEDLRRLGTLLRIGGFALVIDWDATVARDVGPPAEHVYSPGEALERLREAGFTVETVAEPAFPYHYVVRARVSK
jgi:SAM-dependent methyltransferase